MCSVLRQIRCASQHHHYLVDADGLVNGIHLYRGDSTKGLKAGTSINISDGTFNIDSSDDCIHSNGDIDIFGGYFTINAGDDGIHSDGTLNIGENAENDFESIRIYIANCYEGIEGVTINQNSGTVYIISGDDGYNAAGGALDTTTENNFGHEFWVIDDDATVARITEIFTTQVSAFYVADGHHRTAAAARVCEEKMAHNPNHTGKEEYNYFMAVCFPESHLAIIDYNRVVKDLNGLSTKEFFKALEEDFVIECKCDCTKDGGKCSCEYPCHCKCSEIYHPSGLHNFSMYIEGVWYSLTAKPGRYNDEDPIGVLDVTILSNLVLDKILGIKDLRTSKRIDFVGGIRGLGELSRRVDSGEMKVAFALYPVSMQQLINIADTGNIMPPKTTWFEPKLRSGLAIHSLD